MFGNMKCRFALAVGLMCWLVPAAWGDSLELKNGSLIKGHYVGGTESDISFRVGSTVQSYAVRDVVSLSFDESGRASNRSEDPELASRPPEPPPDTAPLDSSAATDANSVNVPAGTHLQVRTVDAIDSDRNQVGDKFQATLEQPLIVNGVTVVPKGADVYGHLTQATQAGHIQGRSELKLELTGIVVNGQTVPLTTGDYSVSGHSRGASSAERVGGGAALGAVIGAIAGGGKGAAIGAGVGGGAGTAVQVVTKGEQVHVPSETLLDFALQQDVRMPMAN
jgi:hypothetical protein